MAMNVLGRRSLSSLFKLLLDIAFYTVSLGGALLVVVVFVPLRTGTSNSSVSLPMRFEIDPSAYRIQAGGAAGARIQDASGDVTVTGPPVTAVVLTMLGVIGMLTVALVVLHRLRRIFRRLVEGQSFLDENARSLRFIGLAVVVGELAWAVFQYLGQQAMAGSLSSAEISFHPAFAPRPSVVLAGLALLIVAETFREGIKMRADLETAREIQTSLVAAEASHYGSVSIHARMQPAAEVGGDYYDVIELGDGRIAFVVADVAGKGPAGRTTDDAAAGQPAQPALGWSSGHSAHDGPEHAPRGQHARQPDDHVLLWRAGSCHRPVHPLSQ